MATNEYYVGSRPKVIVTFRNRATGLVTDPDNIQLNIRQPDGELTNYEWDEYELELTRESEGVYYRYHHANQVGEVHCYGFSTDDGVSADAEDFIVKQAVAVDSATEPVPTSRTFEPARKDDYGLIDDDEKTIGVDSENTYKVSLRNDAAYGQVLESIDSIAIQSGTAGGITINDSAEWEIDGVDIIFRMTGVTVGSYTIRVTFTYKDGNSDWADILVKVVS